MNSDPRTVFLKSCLSRSYDSGLQFGQARLALSAQVLVVYGYMKGYQEALDAILNSDRKGYPFLKILDIFIKKLSTTSI